MEKIWECKIGGVVGDIPQGSDHPMRKAVEAAFMKLTGVHPQFIFSGWGSSLTEGERAVIEERVPIYEKTETGIREAELAAAEARGREVGLQEALTALNEAPTTKTTNFYHAIGYSVAFSVAIKAVNSLLGEKL